MLRVLSKRFICESSHHSVANRLKKGNTAASYRGRRHLSSPLITRVPPPIMTRGASFVQAAASSNGNDGAAAPHPTEDPPAVDWESYHNRWDKIWQTADNGEKLKPGQKQTFDKGQSPPILVDILKRGIVKVEGKRCLVPGCGRGYDVITLALAGASESVGLDYSPTAVEEARAYLDSQAAALVSDSATRSRIRYAQGDFFTYDSDKPSPGWDVAFDYTFFCALRKDMRAAWGATYARLLGPGGRLVCLMYPVDDRDPEAGPPYRVDVEAYVSVLAPHGFRLSFLERVPQDKAFPDREGLEWIGVFDR